MRQLGELAGKYLSNGDDSSSSSESESGDVSILIDDDQTAAPKSSPAPVAPNPSLNVTS